ncbi:AMP-binding protein [Massilia sp. erpn]|uniref:AMP-binding protein n=1 Tax=Massilia sp. erpn TaxID=2738142 RepID=UPI0021032874|nr:AMP-binding protein [Massilia sp. erpn]UTY59277.1 AMP-binding protein [Massilia sp. erpn]
MNHSHSPLSPVTFIERSARAFPEKTALTYLDKAISFSKLLDRSRRLAQALSRLHVEPGDRVAVLSENNVHAVEAHFGIPGAGAVIVMLNPWLSAADVVDLLKYSGAKVLIADKKSFQKIPAGLVAADTDVVKIMLVDGIEQQPEDGIVDYETCLENEDGHSSLEKFIKSEMDPIAINFTSGTTGRPKGVTYSHRAAYLHAVGQVMMIGLHRNSRYLWTLPMFHVNGWGHMWACMAVGCTQFVPDVSLTQGNSAEFIETIHLRKVTHLAGAPRLVRLLAEAPDKNDSLRGLTIVTGGAAPSTTLIQQLELIGVNLIHQYGLNETLGPFVVCEEQEEWKFLSPEARARMRARQGIPAIHAGTGLRVLDANGIDVPHDGRTLGEIAMSGNTVALGYYNNIEATQKAFRGGLFYSGDMAIVYPDGFLEIRDRIKDLIYVETEYGWENISSLEIENVLIQNDAVQDAAVVGVSIEIDGKPAPVLVAFLEIKESKSIDESGMRDYCLEHLSVYKRPQVFYFIELPKTNTGKVRKDILSRAAVEKLISQPIWIESMPASGVAVS